MKYFSISELSASDTARVKQIDNTPPSDVTIALHELIVKILDPLRQAYGRPIRVTSGYRSAALNRTVGGAPASQHLRGEAADITAANKAENSKLFALLKTMDFDQLIDEQDMTWIHVSYRSPQTNRRQILKLK